MKIKEKIKDFKEQHEEVIAYAGMVLGLGMVFAGGYMIGSTKATQMIDIGLGYCCVKDPTLKTHLLDTIEAVNNDLITK